MSILQPIGAPSDSLNQSEGIYAAEDQIHEIGVTLTAESQDTGEASAVEGEESEVGDITLNAEEKGLALELYGEEVGKQTAAKLEAAQETVEPDIFKRYGIDVAKEMAAKAAVGEELSAAELVGMLVGRQTKEKLAKCDQVSMECPSESEAPSLKS